MDSISFWLAALGLPLAVVLGNSVIRFVIKLPLSTAADIALVLIVFDCLVVIQHKDFEAYIKNTALRDAVIAIYVLMIVLGAVCWFLAVFMVEKKISEYEENKKTPTCDVQGCAFYKRNVNIENKFPKVGYILSLCIPIIQILGSVAPFTYR